MTTSRQVPRQAPQKHPQSVTWIVVRDSLEETKNSRSRASLLMISRRGIEVLRHRGRVRRVGVRERVAPRLGLLLSLGAGWPRQPRNNWGTSKLALGLQMVYNTGR